MWWFFCLYALIAFLWALFAVIGDLFRDDKLSGWSKALWILFLVFVPLLGVLVYFDCPRKGHGGAVHGTGAGQPGVLECLHPQCRGS
ncbi:PLDc N-terminal domain-containing protein [Arthrobacter sp. TE12232]